MSDSVLYRSFYFEPSELTKEKEKLKKKYENIEEDDIAVLASKRLPSLLAAIRRLANTHKEIIKFANGLKNTDIRIIAYEFPYTQEEETTQNKIVTILSHRYERFVGKRIWDHFHVYPKDKHISSLLRTAFTRENETFLSLEKGIREKYNQIIKEANQLIKLARMIGSESTTLEVTLKNWKIQSNTKLADLLWYMIMVSFISKKGFVDKEGQEVIVSKLEKLSFNDYKVILQNYLNGFDFEDFHYDLLTQAVKKLNDPRKNAVHWKDFSSSQVEKVKKWVIHNELKKFFAEDTKYQRFKYWGQFVKVMKDAQLIKSPPVAAMDFGNFVVVEFAQVGNAAYFYRKEVYEKQIRPRIKKWSLREVDLKDKDIMIINLPHYVSRNNPDAWHRKFNRYMTQYLNDNFNYKE